MAVRKTMSPHSSKRGKLPDKPSSNTKSKSASTKKPRTPLGVQSLLILHLNAARLRQDGLHLGDAAQASAIVASIGMGAQVVVADATDSADLHKKLAELVQCKKTFDVVVVIAHSNTQEIRVASDRLASWPAFAGYLKPFRPRRLLLVACKAGRWDAGEALFGDLPHLRRIYACPVNASKDFGALMLFAVPYVVAERRPKGKIVGITQATLIALTGRQLREWRRTTDSGNPDSEVFDLLADLLDPLARKVPEALVSLFFAKK